MNFGCKNDNEIMSAEGEWCTTLLSEYCGQQLVSGGCNANFVERFLDNVNPPPKTAAVSAYFVQLMARVCYII